ncbi:MAG: sigma-70 family RNA polymerase sigma factor, partial [Acetatifactor sp.]|nr:sigma-70 family RNA polymerase sigma factor [Acetatifactor sp.]
MNDTQDVYLTAFEQLGSLEDAGKFKSWLYRIAANKSIKYLRKKQSLLPGDDQLEELETEENENFLPEEYALNADKRKLVLEITRKVCTDVQYQTILLYYFNELSIAEIAETMECLEGTVKNRLSVARKKIKEGVLQYEKKSGDKLHSFGAIPFLTALFTAQMQDIPMPSLPINFLNGLPKSKLAALSAKTAKTGGHIMLKSLQAKIIAGIVAAAVAVGGVTTAVVLINQNAEEASAGGLEGNTQNMADAGNNEGTETSPGTVTQPTETDGLTEASHEHNYTEEITVEATCETDGEKTFTCECGDSYTEVIKATGHIFNYVYNEDATYLADGTETATCENCDETDTRTAEGTMLTYTYTDMSATKYAKQTVNVRTLPSTDGEKIGSLSTNDEITVTGQCNETGWYRFEYNGQTAYVAGNYVSDNKVEV